VARTNDNGIGCGIAIVVGGRRTDWTVSALSNREFLSSPKCAIIVTWETKTHGNAKSESRRSRLQNYPRHAATQARPLPTPLSRPRTPNRSRDLSVSIVRFVTASVNY